MSAPTLSAGDHTGIARSVGGSGGHMSGAAGAAAGAVCAAGGHAGIARSVGGSAGHTSLSAEAGWGAAVGQAGVAGSATAGWSWASLTIPYPEFMILELSGEQADALERELRRIIDDDRYPLSPRIQIYCERFAT